MSERRFTLFPTRCPQKEFPYDCKIYDAHNKSRQQNYCAKDEQLCQRTDEVNQLQLGSTKISRARRDDEETSPHSAAATAAEGQR